jgi:hypothetical protein
MFNKNEALISMLIFVTLLVSMCFWIVPKQIPDLSGSPVEMMQGRIVLYDWVLHETTINDDFVLKLVRPRDSQPQYVRVRYGPALGWDAPNPSREDALDRWAFVGKGAVWSLTLHVPRSDVERTRCSSPIAGYKYEDETGTGEIPRFVRSPGAEAEKIPDAQTLPCFILSKGGLKRVSLPNSGA